MSSVYYLNYVIEIYICGSVHAHENITQRGGICTGFSGIGLVLVRIWEVLGSNISSEFDCPACGFWFFKQCLSLWCSFFVTQICCLDIEIFVSKCLFYCSCWSLNFILLLILLSIVLSLRMGGALKPFPHTSLWRGTRTTLSCLCIYYKLSFFRIAIFKLNILSVRL
jgi:hypothetical protein